MDLTTKHSCPTCVRLGYTCVMCQAETERAKRIVHGVIVPKAERQEAEKSGQR